VRITCENNVKHGQTTNEETTVRQAGGKGNVETQPRTQGKWDAAIDAKKAKNKQEVHL